MERPAMRQRGNENRAFDEFVQPCVFENAPSSSTQSKLHYDVFINHRGPDVKQTLAEDIRVELSLIGVSAFLDEKALNLGDLFPMEIEEAMDNASLHIAIFSERYVESPWCLEELAYMVRKRDPIIPIFYRVNPSDLRWAGNGQGLHADSFAQHEKNGRFSNDKLKEWKEALHTVSYMEGLVLKDDDWGPKLEDLAKYVKNKIRPPQGKYPDAVGLDKPRDDVIGLLDLEGQSKGKMVVVYGIGGIGKTTVSKAVYTTLNLSGYNYCRVVMEQDCSKSDIKSLQEQILRDLFNRVVKLRDHVEGCEQLSEAFRKESNPPLFMFIDNALKGSDLAMLLPDLSCLPVQSRILITTRKLDETDLVLHPHIQRCPYLVQPLPSLEAKKLLCKKVVGNEHERFNSDIDIDGLVECCGGIPLVLELVGSKLLSGGSEVSHWVNFLKRTLQEGEGESSEKVVGCVYDSLPDSYKEAFLDVASFFQNDQRHFTAKIVGEVEMKGLEDAALVKTSDNIVTMHDIVSARGKRLSKSNRITDIASWEDVLGDTQKLRQLKGIMLMEDFTGEREKIKIKAESLDLTSQTLRILRVGTHCAEVEGQCMRPFENLRFLYVRSKCNNTFSMRRNKLKKMFVNYSSLDNNGIDIQIAESLSSLTLKGLYTVPDSLWDRSSLDKLALRRCTFVSLPHCLGQLRFLRRLALYACRELTILPESFGNLSSLKFLCLSYCEKLEGLPQSVSQLSSLQQLIMRSCERLSRLPDKFGELKSLKYLHVKNCRSLRNLSEDFGRLTSLAIMNARGCSKLEEKAMDSLVELKSLMFLNIAESPMLEARWEQIKEHHPLLVYSTLEDSVVWERQFRKMMSWEFFHSRRGLKQLDGRGNLVEWIPSPSFVDGQAKVGVLFTMCDLCAPLNSEGLQTVKEKCTELLRQDFHIIYVEVREFDEVRPPQSEEHIRQTLLKLLPGTIAWISHHESVNQLFAYCAHRTLQNGFKDKKRAFFCKENLHVELTLALDALKTFLVEVKPVDNQHGEHSVDDFDRLAPGRSEQREDEVEGFDGVAPAYAEQSEHSVERFDRLPSTHSEEVEHSVEGTYFGSGFHSLFSTFDTEDWDVKLGRLEWYLECKTFPDLYDLTCFNFEIF